MGTGCLGRSLGRPPTVEPAEVEEEPAEGEEEPTEGGEESSVVRISTLPGLVTVLAVGESDVVVGRLLLAGGPTCLCRLPPLWPPLWPLAGTETAAFTTGASVGVSSAAPMAATALPSERLAFRTCHWVSVYSASSRASSISIFLETCSLRSSGSLSRNRYLKRRPAGSLVGRWVRRVCMS